MLAGKTTMRIGGKARYFAELNTREDAEAAWSFAQEKGIPLIVIGSGSNTVFADGEINALVARITADRTEIEDAAVRVEAGKNLPTLLNELAEKGLDLSPLAGIPGTVGGAVFGNAGQGPNGLWIDSFIESVTVFSSGRWVTYTHDDCDFGYRESVFKHGPDAGLLIWETTLIVPKRDPLEVSQEIEQLLKKRIEAQPHLKTAGSVFKATGSVPAWKLIDAAGLKGLRVGDMQITEKHANFLTNLGHASYADAKEIVSRVRSTVQEPLEVEMRFIEEDGSLAF